MFIIYCVTSDTTFKEVNKNTIEIKYFYIRAKKNALYVMKNIHKNTNKQLKHGNMKKSDKTFFQSSKYYFLKKIYKYIVCGHFNPLTLLLYEHCFSLDQKM